jgi:hypothetical protein
MRITMLSAILGLSVLGAACSDSNLPTAPPQPPVVFPTPTPLPSGMLTGTVTDDTRHGVYGARIQVLDGPDAGRFAIANSGQGDGEPVWYTLTGLHPGIVTVRASKEGFLSDTRTVTIPVQGGIRQHFFLTVD